MFWRIDEPVTLRPRTRTLPEEVARAHELPSSWTTVDAMAGDRLLVPDVGEADCHSHDTLAVDFDPLERMARGFWALRRLGSFVVAIPHFEGPRAERYFPPPAHTADVVPALGPEAYESLRTHLSLPSADTVTALSTMECLACLSRFVPASPFRFDADDIARLEASRISSVKGMDRAPAMAAIATFLETASQTPRALEFAAIELAPAMELWLERPHHETAYVTFGRDRTRWGFRFPTLGLVAFPPAERSR